MSRINIQYFARLCSKDETKAHILTATPLFFGACASVVCLLVTAPEFILLCSTVTFHICIYFAVETVSRLQRLFFWCYSASLSLGLSPCSSTHFPCLFIPFILMSTSWAFSTRVSKLFNPFQRSTKLLIWFVWRGRKIDWECLNNVLINRLGAKCTVNGQKQISCFLTSTDWLINWSRGFLSEPYVWQRTVRVAIFRQGVPFINVEIWREISGLTSCTQVRVGVDSWCSPAKS